MIGFKKQLSFHAQLVSLLTSATFDTKKATTMYALETFLVNIEGKLIASTHTVCLPYRRANLSISSFFFFFFQRISQTFVFARPQYVLYCYRRAQPKESKISHNRMTMPGENTDFGCFGSDSEDSEVSQQSANIKESQKLGNGNYISQIIAIATNSTSSLDNGNNDKDEDLYQRRRQLVEHANKRQMAADSAAEAHRNRRPLSSPDFEVFDTVEDTGSSSNNNNNNNNNNTEATRGMGLRSRRKYSCGDEILREHAVMRVPNQQAASSREEAEAMHSIAVQQSFDRLSPETQQFVLKLSNSYNNNNNSDNKKADTSTEVSLAQQIVGVYQTNSFLLGGGRNSSDDAGETNGNRRNTYNFDQNNGGLFLTIARINHSCRPNANHIWRADLQMTLIFATRDIEEGEEFSITYGPSGECLDAAGRRAYLEERFSFECGCEMCEESSNPDDNGDTRMKELNSRQQEISLLLATAAATTATDTEEGGGGAAEEVLESVERCLTLLREQGFGTSSGAYVKQILHYGYQACLLLRRDSRGCMLEESERKARSYLNQELVATRNGEGDGSPNTRKILDMLDTIPVR